VTRTRRSLFFLLRLALLVFIGLLLTEGLLRSWEPARRPESDRPGYLVGPPRITPVRERPEIPAKSPDVFRIFVLGDSFTWGANVQFNHTYPKLLEWLLNRTSTARYEVFNFGVNGANTKDELEMFRRILPHEPDLVLVGYFLNDADVTSDLPPEIQRLVDQSSNPPTRRSWLYEHSRLFRAFSLGLWTRQLTSSQVAHFHDLYDTGKKRWRAHEAVLEELAREGEKSEVPIGVVVWPHLGFPLDGRYPLTEIHRQVLWQLTRVRLQALDLLEAFRGADHYRLQAVPVYDPHPSEIAHRMAAEAIFEWLVDSDRSIARHFIPSTVQPYSPSLPALLQMGPEEEPVVHDGPKVTLTPDLARRRPADPGSATKRILVLGDGYTSGRNVLDAQTFSQHLQWLLDTASRLSYEVTTLAVDGASTRDELASLERAMDQQPTLVLVSYFLDDPYSGSDVPPELASAHEEWKRRSWLQGLPLYRWRHQRSFRRSQVDWIQRLYEPDSSRWRAHIEELAQFGRISARSGVEVRLVIWPHLGFPMTESYPFTEIHHRLSTAMSESDLAVLDLLEVFRGRDPGRLQAIPGQDPRPGEIAHRMAGEAIFDWLRETEPLLSAQISSRFHPNPPNWLGNRDLEPLVDWPF